MNTSDRLQFDAAIFDMDGLLIDSERPSQAAWMQTAEGHNIGDRYDVFLSLIGVNETTATEILSRELDGITDSVQFQRDWLEVYKGILASESIALKAGVHELLQWLEEQGVKRAVATSTNIEMAESKLETVGIRHYFSTVTGGDQVAKGKPEPDIYLAAAASVEANIKLSVGLEDSPNGVRAAHAAGLSVIQVPDLVQPDYELLELGHRVFDDLHSVKRWMQEKIQGQFT